jgi:hypothetical protein
MSYYLAKVRFESGEVKKNGDPVYTISQFLVSAESVLDVETKVASYMEGTLGDFETIQVTKTKIETVIYDKERYEDSI